MNDFNLLDETKTLGITTFVTSALPHNECGSNGLPLTPNSIKVLGRAQVLKTFRHKNLCRYIDFYRGKHDRILCVVEHHVNNADKLLLKQKAALHEEWNGIVCKLGYEVLQALVYLNEHTVEHHNLTLKNILLDSENSVKLSNHGLFYMTEFGSLLNFPVGQFKYLPPEELVCMKKIDRIINVKSDVWSLGVILLELSMGEKLFTNLSIQETITGLLEIALDDDVVIAESLLNLSNMDVSMLSHINENLMAVIRSCLKCDPSQRPAPYELLHSDLFAFMRDKYPLKEEAQRTTLFTEGCDCLQLEIIPEECKVKSDHLASRDLSEIFHLWKLAGGDVMNEVKKQGTVHSIPPILTLPQMMSLKADVIGLESFWANLYDETTTIVALDAVRNRLKNIPPEAYYPLLETSNDSPNTETASQMKATSELPLAIKDKDIEYQLHRVFLFSRLLLGYPYLRDRIWKESRIDIPPHYRGKVWAALLDVSGDVKTQYMEIDKETPLSADRQIAVDIPRCHQYDALLSSPTAHDKFKRVIKAWLKSHPHLTYWQGLDSLCAAFLHLHFNDEHLAWASLSKFIDKFLHNFFLKDNSSIIQEYLAVFCHLIAFHDPVLANHLSEIEFFPELYSIPWFLTMFTHVFPLQKIAHLWDTLLLGNSSFPLCVGVAILRQLRSQLLGFGFNECILLFSDLPEIDIDDVVQESIRLFCSTPKSATYRAHAKKTSNEKARQQISYYSDDYNQRPQNELTMTAVPLSELKEQACPRISADDLIDLSELRGPMASKTPVKRDSKNGKPRIVILDVRPESDFLRAAIPGSLNMPYATSFTNEGQLASPAIVKNLQQIKPRVIIVAGSKNNKDDILFAGKLVKLNYKGVCILHNGIDVLRSTGLLTIQ